MRLRLSILLLSLYALASASGCQRADSETAPPPIAVTVRVVGQADDPRSQIYSASLQPNREVAVAFQVTGYVKTIKQVPGVDGRHAKYSTRRSGQGGRPSGDRQLRHVRGAGDAAFRSALQREGGGRGAARDFQRDSELFAKHVIASSQFDYATQQFQTAKAQVGQAEAALRQGQITLGYCKLVAPMDGVLLDRTIEIGSLVEANTVAFRIADTREMKAVFGVSDIQIARFKMANRKHS